MRIVFPLVIVMIAASLGPIEAVKLAINEHEQYEVILNGAHIGLMGFGGAFLGMVGLKYFFDADKEVEWIAAIERQLARTGNRDAISIGFVFPMTYQIGEELGRARGCKYVYV